MKREKIKFILLVAFIVAVGAGVKFMEPGQYLDQERLSVWIEGFGLMGPVVFILIYCVAPSFMLPGLPITIAGGVLFGPVWGVVYVAIGATIGSSIAFLIARSMGRKWVEGLLKGSRWQELDQEVEKKGWKIVAFTRLIPLFPFNVLNYAFGLTRIKFSHYVLASFIFMLPGITAFVVFSSSLLDLLKGKVPLQFLAGLVLVVIVSLIPILHKKFKQGGTDKQKPPEPGC